MPAGLRPLLLSYLFCLNLTYPALVCNLRVSLQYKITMASITIFIVEDDPWYGEMLKHALSLNPDYKPVVFQSGKECLLHLRLKPDIITVDFGLPDMDGISLIEQIHAVDRTIPVIAISGQEEIAVALDILKKGAADYVIKNEHTRELLWNCILKIRETIDLKKEVASLKGQLQEKFAFGKNMVGSSPGLKQVFSLIEKAVKSNINVSVSGETGTGKEEVAKAIHYNSDRKKMPFVAVNMAAIPSELIESELFGYEKGAFTGANARRIGKFEEADGGTLFLDEIAELNLNLQSKILRALQEREFVRLGGNQKVKVNIRLITATHRDLGNEVKNSRFREDLFYRIMGLPIELPPLRQRGNDVLLLAKHFADSFVRDNNLQPMAISVQAKEALLKHAYPGNIRELKAVMELACVMSNGKEITGDDIRFNTSVNSDSYTIQEKTLKGHTNEIIAFYLKKYNRDVMEVAKRLDIGKSTIYDLIRNKEILLDESGHA